MSALFSSAALRRRLGLIAMSPRRCGCTVALANPRLSSSRSRFLPGTRRYENG
jgi:hypothetical protein